MYDVHRVESLISNIAKEGRTIRRPTFFAMSHTTQSLINLEFDLVFSMLNQLGAQAHRALPPQL